MNPLLTCESSGNPNAVRVAAVEVSGAARNEEWLNAATHAAGVVLSLIGSLVLLERAADRGTLSFVACAIYAASLVVLYLASTVYHLVREQALKRVLRTVDHVCIFLLIAGTYTPVTLLPLGRSAWVPLILIWGVAAAGALLKVAAADWAYGSRSTLLYAAAGLLGIPLIPRLLHTFPEPGAACILGGGVAYIAGLIFFLQEKPYFHAVWHIFVLVGSVCHYCAIFLSVVPTSA